MINTYSLDQRLYHIGLQLSGVTKIRPNSWIDIETTLHEATLDVDSDSRIFSLLCSWVIIEKLMKLQKNNFSPWLVALAVFASNHGFHQWKRLIKKLRLDIALVDVELALSAISIKGEEPNFRKYGFLIPKGSIRARSSDALSTQQLIKKNIQYRNRLLYGASWRSDIISAIQIGLKTPYIIAKTLGCSYEPAHRIFKEYLLASSV